MLQNNLNKIRTNPPPDDYLEEEELEELEELDTRLKELNKDVDEYFQTDNEFVMDNEAVIDKNLKTCVEKNKYIFESPSETNLDDCLANHTFSTIPNIHICSYYINTKGKSPFLQYFLYKEKRENNTGESFTFPTFKYDPYTNVIAKVITIMEMLCMSYYKGSNYIYKGFKIYKNDIYIFFDCSQLDIESVRLDRNNDLWLVLIDEIINKGYVCNYKITDTVIDFFYNNNELIFLRDLNYEIYETPTVLYASCPERRLHFCSVFGISSFSDELNLFGNYYYFTDFKNIFKQTRMDKSGPGSGSGSEEKETGIIRLAVFLGKLKMVNNVSSNPVDESEITRYLLDKYNTPNNKIFQDLKLQMRISDRGGLWTSEYDSLFMGRIELDDGRIMENYPIFVVKEYDQQIVLTSHIQDKTRANNSEQDNCCIR